MNARGVERSGFALAAVLWVLAVGTVLAAAAALRGRTAFDAARNRVNADRAAWLAEGCVAEVRESIDATLEDASSTALPKVWRTLDEAVADRDVPATGCRLSLQAVGSAIDVNGASEAMLHKYIGNAVTALAAEKLTDALLDWRDSDDDPRPAGAERAWYTANRRPVPRNDSLASVQELALVRGFDAYPELTSHLSTEPARVCLTTAPATVLAALPGFTDDAVAQVLRDRTSDAWFGDLDALRGRVPSAAAESLAAHAQELASMTTLEPEGWILTVVASAGSPPVAATIELRLGRYDTRAVVLWRRTQ
jgi:type II secretory pathway component PulK